MSVWTLSWNTLNKQTQINTYLSTGQFHAISHSIGYITIATISIWWKCFCVIPPASIIVALGCRTLLWNHPNPLATTACHHHTLPLVSSIVDGNLCCHHPTCLFSSPIVIGRCCWPSFLSAAMLVFYHFPVLTGEIDENNLSGS